MYPYLIAPKSSLSDNFVTLFSCIFCSTLTKPVAFEKCIVAIRDHAFVNSEYPVCVTLEDHLTSPLQATAAEVR